MQNNINALFIIASVVYLAVSKGLPATMPPLTGVVEVIIHSCIAHTHQNHLLMIDGTSFSSHHHIGHSLVAHCTISLSSLPSFLQRDITFADLKDKAFHGIIPRTFDVY